jgi:hypothetical protein
MIALILAACFLGSPGIQGASAASIVLTPAEGNPGSYFTISGSSFYIGGYDDEYWWVTIIFEDGFSSFLELHTDVHQQYGSFTPEQFMVPYLSPGTYLLRADGPADSASAWFTVTTPTLSLTPASGPAGSVISVEGSHFFRNQIIILARALPNDRSVDIYFNGKFWYQDTVELDGSFQEYVTIPAGTAPGTYWVRAHNDLNDISARFNVSPQTGSLYVDSDPKTADIYLNGVFRGVTPFLFSDVQPGNYRVVVCKAGFDDYETELTILAGGSNVVFAPLTIIPGSVSISSDPPLAEVYLDGAYRGMTPLEIPDVQPEVHVVTVKKSGYYDYTTQLTVRPGETASHTALLRPDHGFLTVRSSAPEADLYIDRKFVGCCPGPFDVPSGMHSLLVRKNGYLDYTTSFTIAPGEELFVSAQMIPVWPIIIIGTVVVLGVGGYAVSHVADAIRRPRKVPFPVKFDTAGGINIPRQSAKPLGAVEIEVRGGLKKILGGKNGKR